MKASGIGETVEDKLRHSLQQQKLLADISQKVNSMTRSCPDCTDILRLIGEHTNVSRISVFLNNSTGTATRNAFTWCNEGITDYQNKQQNLSYAIVPSLKKKLVEQGRIVSADINQLPDDFSSILRPLGIKSILIFPLFVQAEFSGFIGFDECLVNKQWDSDEVELLRTIANIISATFERNKYHQQLHDSETQLKMAIENTDTGLWDWNIPTGQVYFNDIWLKQLGYDRSEIKPHLSAWEKLVHPDDMPAAEEALNKHLAGETGDYQNLHRLLTKSGDWKWVLDRGKVIEWNDAGEPIRAIGTHIDMDRHKKVEDELRIANATKDKFFSIIAHDLRGPIGSLMQISELIAEKGNVDEATLYKFLNSQKELTKSTYRLLENLLNWAKYNEKQIENNPKILNINNIIDETVEHIHYQLSKKSIELTKEYSGVYEAYADENMVKLIIRNLLSNALKFTPNKGSVSIGLAHTNGFLTVSIEDSGVGIAKENIDKILSDDQFFTTAGTENEKGTGLGLKICKNFISMNHGSIKIESEPAKGTRISFTLPRQSV